MQCLERTSKGNKDYTGKTDIQDDFSIFKKMLKQHLIKLNMISFERLNKKICRDKMFKLIIELCLMSNSKQDISNFFNFPLLLL